MEDGKDLGGKGCQNAYKEFQPSEVRYAFESLQFVKPETWMRDMLTKRAAMMVVFVTELCLTLQGV